MAAQNKNEAGVQARAAINKWAMGFTAVAWIPCIHYVLTAADVVMVVQVGTIYGVDLDRASAGVVFSTVAGPFLGRTVAHGILDFIPWLWPIKSAVAYGVTKAIGEALIGYFHDCSPLPA
jgi:uncharacterized protein (DUF697 family)